MFKIIILFLAFILIYFPQTAYAQSDFSLAFDVEYAFDENGNALVTKHITLTNLNSDTYPSAYLVDVPDDSSDIAAANENGTLDTETLHEAGRKMVRITIPDR